MLFSSGLINLKLHLDDITPSDKVLHKILLSKHGEKLENFDENYSSKHYNTVKEGLELFCNDPLLCVPGSTYNYSSLAYSLVSRLIECITEEDFVKHMDRMLKDIGMMETQVDLNNKIIYNRGRYYCREKNGELKNVSYVDNSYKWAGGGYLSHVEDLTKFGNEMLNSFQDNNGVLKPSTVKCLWQIQPKTLGAVSKKFPGLGYGLGWTLQPKHKAYDKEIISHSGVAVGVSSILMIVPSTNQMSQNKSHDLSHTRSAIDPQAVRSHNDICSTNQVAENKPYVFDATNQVLGNKPHGLVISLIVNMQSVDLRNTALKIVDILNERKL